MYLNQLHDHNQTLFYKVVEAYLKEMLPIIYTPIIGDAVQRFNFRMRRSRGLFIAYPDRDRIDVILRNRRHEKIKLVVVTDGEAILGIGDWGVGGMDISIGKSMVYTLCSGINPNQILPIHLDVGTNNERLLNDSMYLGWRHSRIQGATYDGFIAQFVAALKKTLPQVYLHWEDVGRENAHRILQEYRNQLCTFNDDIQGTALVILANIEAAIDAIRSDISQQRIIIFGAGTAGIGIADQLYDAMLRRGMTPAAARKCFWLIDRDGLLVKGKCNITRAQQPYLRDSEEIQDWKRCKKGSIALAEVVKRVHPSVLIGCSTVYGAFTESVVRSMANYVAYPIIMPLSNPTSHCEAIPEDLLKWTDGKAIVATGSPFPPVHYRGRTVHITQGNNAFIFPGLGLGVLACQATKVTDDMLWAAGHALREMSPARQDCLQPLLPPLSAVKETSRRVAKAVIAQAIEEGLTTVNGNDDLDALLDAIVWQPNYLSYKQKQAFRGCGD